MALWPPRIGDQSATAYFTILFSSRSIRILLALQSKRQPGKRACGHLPLWYMLLHSVHVFRILHLRQDRIFHRICDSVHLQNQFEIQFRVYGCIQRASLPRKQSQIGDCDNHCNGSRIRYCPSLRERVFAGVDILISGCSCQSSFFRSLLYGMQKMRKSEETMYQVRNCINSFWLFGRMLVYNKK